VQEPETWIEPASGHDASYSYHCNSAGEIMERLQWCFSKPRRKLSRQLAALALYSSNVSCLKIPPLLRRFKSSYKIYFENSPLPPPSLRRSCFGMSNFGDSPARGGIC
jgi:hypothetical protein